MNTNKKKKLLSLIKQYKKLKQGNAYDITYKGLKRVLSMNYSISSQKKLSNGNIMFKLEYYSNSVKGVSILFQDKKDNSQCTIYNGVKQIAVLTKLNQVSQFLKKLLGW